MFVNPVLFSREIPMLLTKKLIRFPLLAVLPIALAVSCTSDEETIEEPIAAEESEALEPPTDDAVGLEDETVAAFDLSAMKIYFGFDQASLSSEAQMELEKLANHMSANADLQVQITGHADSRGTTEYNLSLGEQRAYAVKSFLEGLGVASERLSTMSMGEESPSVEGEGEDVWSLNRRAEFSATF